MTNSTIAVGEISESQAVAIGDGARATINQFTEIIVNLDNIEEMAPVPGEPPYKGLAYFTEADADKFFGREQLCEGLLLRLRSTPFLLIVGASGSGKSSLLRAGIIPPLRAQGWGIHLMTPTARPLEKLANTLTRDNSSYQLTDEIRVDLQTNPQTLRQVANKLASQQAAGHLLLVIDQFEELFTLCKDEQLRQAFIDNLLTAVKDQGAITILLGIRADFYERCAHYEGLRELVAQHQALIGPMSQADIVRVIAEPAKRGNWQFVTGLVEQILEDVGQEPGRLPLLSHALLETWSQRRGVVMTLGGYRAAEGVEGAIARSAENVIQLLNESETAAAERIFLTLTELGEGAEDTRRIASRASLLRQGDADEVNAVLEMLVSARLIAINNQEVEVAHEALIRRWPRLKSWINDSRDRLRFERQVAKDAQLWQESMARDPGALYRGARLAQAEEWCAHGRIALEPLAVEFLEESRHLAEREAREKEALSRRQLLLARSLAGTAVAILLLVAGIAASPTLSNWNYQRRSRAPLVLIKANEHAFYLEANEVSNEQYRFCVEAGACSLPQDPTKGYLDQETDEAKKHLPVEAVSAYQANEYCAWLGRRLPTAAEWRLAYDHARLLPQPPNIDEAYERIETQMVLPNHAIEEQTIYHLVGNVWEWTASFDSSGQETWDGDVKSLCTFSSEETNCKPRALQIVGGGTNVVYFEPEDIAPQTPFSSGLSFVGFRCAANK